MGEIEIKYTMELSKNYYTPDKPIENKFNKNNLSIESIKESAVRSIKNLFLSPPSDEKIETILSLTPDDDSINEVIGLFQIHNFNSNDTQFGLLCDYDYTKLSQENAFKFCASMSYICNKRSEYSLSIKYLDKALTFTNDREMEINVLLERAIVYSLMNDEKTISTSKKILRMIKDYEMDQKYTKGVYHILGIFYWKINEFDKALNYLERERSLITEKKSLEYLEHIAFMSVKYELFDPRLSIEFLKEIIGIIEEEESLLSEIRKAETYSQIVALNQRYKVNTVDEDIKYLEKALSILKTIDGELVKTAYTLGVLETLYKKVGNSEKQTHCKEFKDKILNDLGTTVDKYKIELINAFSSQDDKKISILETAAIENEELLIYWFLVYLNHLIINKDFNKSIEVGNYALTKLPNDIAAYDKALIHQILASSYAGIGDKEKNIIHLIESIKIDSGNSKIRWQLCNNAFVDFRFDIAKENAIYLIENQYEMPGPYRINAHIEYAENNIDKAIKILKDAKIQFPEHEGIKTELDELYNIEDGLIDPADSKYFNRYSNGDFYVNNKSIESVSYKIVKLDDFAEKIVLHIKDFVHLIKKTPPIFIKMHLEDEYEIKEGDFRDELQRNISHLYKNTNAEVQIKDGRADLFIRDNDTNKEIIIEFKIWARNDYRDCIDQLRKYYTDIDDFGIIFMINTNKSSINSKYIKEIILNNPTYKSGSFRDSIFAENYNLDCFYSEHESIINKRIKVIHYIYNLF